MQHPFLTQTKRRVNPCSRDRDTRARCFFIKLIFLWRLRRGFCSIRGNKWDRWRNARRNETSGKKVETLFPRATEVNNKLFLFRVIRHVT